MGVKLIYGDIAVGAKEDFTPTISDKQNFVNLSQLQQEDFTLPYYISPCELYQTILDDREMEFLPSDLNTAKTGLWSLQQSNADKTFTAPITLTLLSPQYYSSQGIMLTFDKGGNQFCTDLNVKWYQGSTLLSDMDFTPGDAVYYCENKVDAYNKLVITFRAMNLPHAYLKLESIDYGTMRIFLGDEIAAASINQEISPISQQITINTFDFTLRSKSNVDYVFQSKQPIEIYFNGQLKGVHFVDKSKRTKADTWSVQTIDYIGLLDKSQFLGGIYSNKNAYDLLVEIMTEARVPFKMADSLKAKAVSGHLPISSCREALMQLAFAIGAVVDTSNTNKVTIDTLSLDNKHSFTLNEIYQGQSYEQSDKLTQFDLTSHTYIATTETVEAYDASDSGTGNEMFVAFSEPLHSLTITNGSIVESGANYAVINANSSNCILTGRKYNHLAKVVSIKNPLVTAADLPNVVSIEKATLIGNSNVEDIAQRCYDYFAETTTVNAKLLITGEKTGDLVTLDSDFLAPKTGHIEKMNYNLNGNIIAANVVVK